MNAKKSMALLVAVGLALGVAVVALLGPRETPANAAASASSTQAASVGQGASAIPVRVTGAARGPVAAAPLALREDPAIAQLDTYVRERFGGEKLKNAYVQVKLLEHLMRYFQQRYPDRWEEALREYLRLYFPEQAGALEAMLRARLDYEQWMRDNETYLQQLGNEERRKNVREQREKLFGKEAAEQIWASELKNQAVADSLSALDARTDVKLADKVKLYRESLGEAYGEHTEAWLERHRQEAVNRFLDLASVQKELTEMKPEERARGLRELRAGLGLDAEALERWDSLDRERDTRWDAGAKYMREREELARQHTGAALEEHLRPLRERYFGAEASTLAEEEQSGFFRFSRPRVWGRN
ncbi:hypothetical protein P2318_33175 [Myxococcaceae bacterium GXIMD 01537]